MPACETNAVDRGTALRFYAFFLRRFFVAFFVPFLAFLAFFVPFFAALRFFAMYITSFLAEIVHRHCVLSKEIFAQNSFDIADDDVPKIGATVRLCSTFVRRARSPMARE